MAAVLTPRLDVPILVQGDVLIGGSEPRKDGYAAGF